jgi:hypothetical protein
LSSSAGDVSALNSDDIERLARPPTVSVCGPVAVGPSKACLPESNAAVQFATAEASMVNQSGRRIKADSSLLICISTRGDDPSAGAVPQEYYPIARPFQFKCVAGMTAEFLHRGNELGFKSFERVIVKTPAALYTSALYR